MRRRPDHLLRSLLAAALAVLALMHPETTARLAELATGLLLAVVAGIAQAAAAQPEAALLTAGGIYLAHQIRTHRPRTTART